MHIRWLDYPVLFQEMNIMEYFVPNRVTSVSSSSYGSFTYDQFEVDANNNIKSMRRTATGTGKIEFFTFEWKKVLL